MTLDTLKNVDIYLIDQIVKGRIPKESFVLDAGCGNGRNFRYFAKNGYDIVGIDPKIEAIEAVQTEFPDYHESLYCSSIEDWKTDRKFDFIICSAVLHFAKNQAHFDQLFEALVQYLKENGILFVRMTTTIGMETLLDNTTTEARELPDGSLRYLITRAQIHELLEKHALVLLDPIKTVVVDQQRSMVVLVFQKKA